MLIAKQKEKEKARPTMQDCLDSLEINRFDLTHIRQMKTDGMLKFCKEKIKHLETLGTPEISTDTTFKIFCSLMYDYFRKEYKDKGSEWKEETFNSLAKQMELNLNELQKQESKVQKLTLLSSLISRAYMCYRKIVTNTD